MTTATAGLEISCAKPACHWKGPPAEAHAHTCPTPAEAEKSEPTAEPTPGMGPFAGMTGMDGAPIEGPTDPAHRYAVVWADGAGKTVTIGTAETEDDALALAESTFAGKGTLEVVDRGPGLALAEQVAADEPADSESPIGYDDDPTERADLEKWLIGFGNYDEAGIPQDEKTATLDARLAAYIDDDGEPDLDDEPDAIPGETPLEPEATAPEGFVHAESMLRPMPLVIAEALEQQTGVASYRWLVILTPDDPALEAELIGRGRTRSDADEIRDRVKEQGQVGGTLEVLKTQDILEDAETLKAEIEKRRELVVPDTTVEPEPLVVEPGTVEERPDDEEPDDQADDDSDLPPAAEAPPADPDGHRLFDRSAYEKVGLQIPSIDGHEIDRIGIDLAGGVMLDRSKTEDVELFNRLATGTHELWIEATWAGSNAKPATNKEGELDVVVAKKSLRVTGLRIVAPEDLGQMEALEAVRFAVRRALRAGVYFDVIDEAAQLVSDAEISS